MVLTFINFSIYSISLLIKLRNILIKQLHIIRFRLLLWFFIGTYLQWLLFQIWSLLNKCSHSKYIFCTFCLDLYFSVNATLFNSPIISLNCSLFLGGVCVLSYFWIRLLGIDSLTSYMSVPDLPSIMSEYLRKVYFSRLRD